MKRPANPVATRAAAEGDELAAMALSFLAGHPERLGTFLAISGLDPSSLRAAAGEPGFTQGILAYIASDESVLREFAGSQNLRIEDIGRKIARLTGDSFWNGP